MYSTARKKKEGRIANPERLLWFQAANVILPRNLSCFQCQYLLELKIRAPERIWPLKLSCTHHLVGNKTQIHREVVNCLCRQGKRKMRLQWKCIWSGTHILEMGQESRRLHQGWEIQQTAQKEQRLKEAGMCAQGTDGSTALRSRDPYIYWTHVELKKCTLIKKVCPLLPSSHLSMESPL